MGIDVLISYDADFADLLFGDECEQVRLVTRCRDCVFMTEGVCDRWGEYPSATGVWYAVAADGFCDKGRMPDGR